MVGPVRPGGQQVYARRQALHNAEQLQDNGKVDVNEHERKRERRSNESYCRSHFPYSLSDTEPEICLAVRRA
jgi:hypothetical protein